ncbi:MAG: hypothetical protein K0Q48_749 [Bacillota bacterium]|nr:hypothetical protein [Bacillota bacterium]
MNQRNHPNHIEHDHVDLSHESYHTDHDHTSHHAGHDHGALLGAAEEIPAVFSQTLFLQFDKDMTENAICALLYDWLTSIQHWALFHHHYIGHIKIFAEFEEGFQLWLSATGREISVKNTAMKLPKNPVRRGTAAVTAIVFGTDEASLKVAVLNGWEETLALQSGKAAI